MVIWILVLAVLTIFSYLSDMGLFQFLQNFRVPFLNASIMSLLILLCTAAMLVRILTKVRSKEKETLGTKVGQLYKELQALKEKQES
ncbi:MAG: hypothetical protein ISS41_03820 [Candidatus Aminicenantes bacterium]|nr:hypothetical protein [Candidatus Aminicenantes bacterium]MBL7082742.1 hypothetical protein [Candidatus Aminicenantes bacterium]